MRQLEQALARAEQATQELRLQANLFKQRVQAKAVDDTSRYEVRERELQTHVT